MVILAPSPGPLWGGCTPKTHSPGHRCPPVVIGRSFLSAGRAVFLDRWHWSIHHGFVPLRTLRAHQGSAEWAIYHPAQKNRGRSEEMKISHRVFPKAYNSLTYFQAWFALLQGSLSPVWFIRRQSCWTGACFIVHLKEQISKCDQAEYKARSVRVHIMGDPYVCMQSSDFSPQPKYKMEMWINGYQTKHFCRSDLLTGFVFGCLLCETKGVKATSVFLQGSYAYDLCGKVNLRKQWVLVFIFLI